MPQTHKVYQILVVDDAKENHVLIKRFLDKLPYTLTFAIDGEDALKHYEKKTFDVVLMDIEMPKLDGYQTTQAFREVEKKQNRKTVPIIAITGHTENFELMKMQSAGFDDFLKKPLSQDLLNSFLTRWLENKSH